jgi:hypothetical protein
MPKTSHVTVSSGYLTHLLSDLQMMKTYSTDIYEVSNIRLGIGSKNEESGLCLLGAPNGLARGI